MKTNTSDGGPCRCEVPALRSADSALPYRRCSGCGKLRFAQPGGVRRAVAGDSDPAVPVGPHAEPLMATWTPPAPRVFM